VSFRVEFLTTSEKKIVTARRHLRGWRRVVFPLLAVLAGVGFIVVLEGLLWVTDVGRPQGYTDPFVGFSGIHPFFGLVEEEGVYRTETSRQPFFEPQEFLAEKPQNGFRVFCLGGSTVRGRPYQVDTAFSKWLQLEMQTRHPDRLFESVNCGGLSYASYRLIPILQEVLKHQPDVIVVATGHNEFLEDRTYEEIKQRNRVITWMQERAYSLHTVTLAREVLGTKREDADGITVLPAEVEAALDSRTGYASYHYDREWQTHVVDHFEQSLRVMVDLCQDAGVPLILVKLGANLRDCPPFKSELHPDIKPEQERAWYVEFNKGTEVDEISPSQALQHYQAAEAIEDEHALLAFRIGRCLDRMGRTDEAGLYYRRARDWDVCPLRILDSMQQVVARIAMETETPFVDAHQLLVKADPDGIPGYDQYMDHVHPTIGAHQKMAAGLAAKIAEIGLIEFNDLSAAGRRQMYRDYFNSLERSYLANGGRRVQWLEHWAQRQRLIAETGPQDDRGWEDLGHRNFDFENVEATFNAYETACKLNPNSLGRILDHAFELFQQGRPGDALLLVKWLRQSEFIDGIREELAAAEFVVAVELENTSVATATLNENRDLLLEADANDSRWLSTAAEVLPRFEAGAD